MQSKKTFQDIIAILNHYWASNGCVQLQSYDIEMGAGTLSPHTALRVLDASPWNVCYAQYSRRPTDARFAQNPNRLGSYYQFQVILKPSPQNIQELCVRSLDLLGIDTKKHDIRFVEDNWKNDSIGASGLGFEVWCDGMEVIQFTYMRRMGGIECPITSCEITYGLERVAMYVQNVDNIFDIVWAQHGDLITKYSDIHSKEYEIEQSEYLSKFNINNDTEHLIDNFDYFVNLARDLLSQKLVLPAYEACLKASHCLNILDARQALSQVSRAEKIFQVRNEVQSCCAIWIEKHGKK